MSLADETLFVPGAGSLFEEGRSFAWNLISTRQTQFSYFDQLLERPIWKGSKVLDFGGNVGTFLRGAGKHVDHDDYWCIDWSPTAHSLLSTTWRHSSRMQQYIHPSALNGNTAAF